MYICGQIQRNREFEHQVRFQNRIAWIIYMGEDRLTAAYAVAM